MVAIATGVLPDLSRDFLVNLRFDRRAALIEVSELTVSSALRR